MLCCFHPKNGLTSHLELYFPTPASCVTTISLSLAFPPTSIFIQFRNYYTIANCRIMDGEQVFPSVANGIWRNESSMLGNPNAAQQVVYCIIDTEIVIVVLYLQASSAGSPHKCPSYSGNSITRFAISVPIEQLEHIGGQHRFGNLRNECLRKQNRKGQKQDHRRNCNRPNLL